MSRSRVDQTTSCDDGRLPVQMKVAVNAGDHIGEAPIWDATAQRLLWVDHMRGRIHEAKPDGEGGWREVRQWNLGSPVAAVVPRVRGGLLVVGALEILLLDDEERTTSFARIGGSADGARLNDAKCDRRGRLWAGSLTTQLRDGAAALYRIDPDGTVHTMLEGLTLANGLDWSPDDSLLYLVDTAALSVKAFDFDLEKGTISNGRTVIALPRGDGGPNGLAVDDEGCVWLALTGGGQVRRYLPTGEEVGRLYLPTAGPTSCAFGGTRGCDLFITSRSGRMPEFALALGVKAENMESADATAGALFVCRPGARGAPAAPFGF